MTLGFSPLLKAIGNYASITAFIEGGELCQILSVIGTNEYEAANYALQNMSSAADKKAQVRSAVTHLESAHVAFKNIHTPKSLWRDLLRRGSMLDACCLDIYTCCLMVICYLYLKEEMLVRQLLKEIDDTWKRYFYLKSDRAENTIAEWLSLINPTEWSAIVSGIELPQMDIIGFYHSVQQQL